MIALRLLFVVVTEEFAIQKNFLIVDGGAMEVVRLPFGRYHLGVNVVDSFGGAFTYEIGIVAVSIFSIYPPCFDGHVPPSAVHFS